MSIINSCGKLNKEKSVRWILMFLVFLVNISLLAQTQLTTDELFVKAKDAAFNLKDRNLARQLCKQALTKSPDYADISIFLGRLYTWDNIYDSARVIFNNVIKKDSSNSDAISAAIDLEYWSGNSSAALKFCNLGVLKYPASADFLLKRAIVLEDLERYNDAFLTLEKIFKIDKSNTEALVLAERLKDKTRINSIGVTYQYEKFDKTFDPWQLGSLSYSRRLFFGTTIFRVNFARRFENNGTQYEIDMYPGFAPGIYSYLNFGYSKDGIFPKQRYGASLYFSLPISFEIDGGFRLLKYSSDTWIYTFALGKYWGNYWFSFRTFITPQVEKASHSYSLIIRYYLSGADDYLSLSAGTGISPEENSVDLLGNWLKSDKLGIEYQNKLSRKFILSISGDYSREEYLANEFRTKISVGFGLKFLF
ncbi:MAG: YaiO family outer membrane beta-barrel protein [Melioribacter sp.]|nr:YaiO family outer membrane beta-barrel protein [Melioribacter sp.]